MVISAWPKNSPRSARVKCDRLLDTDGPDSMTNRSPRSARVKFDQLLDTDGLAGILRRDDLSMRTERTVCAERRT
ncbi:hypothetical protein [Streptosporangium vulgare]|uniref:hypothetical protein n=1 Tax=Streptosporangium vulgare TaxID=46190 RepID=UPI0031D469A3